MGSLVWIQASLASGRDACCWAQVPTSYCQVRPWFRPSKGGGRIKRVGEGMTLGVLGSYCTSKKTVENKVKPGSPRPKQTEKERMQTRLNVAPQEPRRNWAGSCVGKVIVMQEGGPAFSTQNPRLKHQTCLHLFAMPGPGRKTRWADPRGLQAKPVYPIW